MLTATGTGDLTEDTRAFLQHRVARFGLLGGSLFGLFLAFRTVVELTASKGALGHPSFLFHALATGALLATWLICRRGRYGVRFVRYVETIGLLTAGAASVAMGAFIPHLVQPQRIVWAALTLGLVARAVYVPSSGRRTLVVSAAIALVAVVGCYLNWLRLDPATWNAILAASPGGSDEIKNVSGLAAYMAVDIAVWWVCTLVLATATSRVVYGLRKRVRDATRLGQYTLERKLGEGGMGMVYRAHHGMLRRPTAIKLLPAEKAGEQSLERFEREVRLTARLTHPNTVTIFDYGRTPDGVFYYAMELLDGATLDDVVEVSGAQPPARVAAVLADCAGALAEAHGVGLIHRDIKPANVMLSTRGGRPDVAKVLDFGLVKELENEAAASLTGDHSLLGTPLYMPPEAISDPDTVDARSDLYALGAVGYFLLTGEHVFAGKTVMEVCVQHLQATPIPPSERLGRPVHAGLEALIMACLAKPPADRPPSAAALERQLRELDDLGGWNAAEWWEEYGPALTACRSDESVSGTARTLAVDPEARSD